MLLVWQPVDGHNKYIKSYNVDGYVQFKANLANGMAISFFILHVIFIIITLKSTIFSLFGLGMQMLLTDYCPRETVNTSTELSL